MLRWIQNKLPKLSVNNFTTDWTNGIFIGALVDAIAPGLCPDWSVWNSKNSLTNAKEAMSLAEYWLNVEPFLTSEELIGGKFNEQSLITYLSQFPNAKLRSGAPLRVKRYSNKIVAYGPGIEPTGPIVGAPANFTVETVSAGKGSIDVIIRNPKGLTEKPDIRFNNDKNLTYSVTYVPRMLGNYKIYVTFSGKDIPNSPFDVNVAECAGDPSKVIGFGPGLQPDGVYIGRTTYFDILTKG